MCGIDEYDSIIVDVMAILLWLMVIALIVWEEICHSASLGRLIFSVVAMGYSGYAVIFFGN